ncbi:MAG: hypothetical protein C4539_01670 [Ignavibacteriales bacterium]|nr:MAG: hypothetical protein C4539_01670 [Ignavibacteriales bacterium]
MKKVIIKILLLVALLSVPGFSQTDSLTQSDTSASQSYVMKKSSIGALLRSAIIPGWGQIYNESYWKAPIVWGFTGYFLYNWIRNNNKYKDYASLYSNSLTLSDNVANINNLRSYYKESRDFYHDQRDLFTIYMFITYALNLLDAYVDAHLFDFNVDEEPMTNSMRLNVRINF